MRSIEQQLEEHKIRLATLGTNEEQLSNALSAEKQEEHKLLLANSNVRALSAEKQLEEHKLLLANSNARALSAEKQLEEHKLLLAARLSDNVPAEKPVYHITRTRRT
jgi:hypothetical protein